MELFKIKLFEPKDSNLIESNLYSFNDLKQLMRNNLKVHVVVTVSSVDSYFKKKKKKVEIQSKKKRKRKRYKWVKVTTEEQLTDLVNARIKAIRGYLNELKIRDTKYEIAADIKVVKPKKKKRRRKKKKAPPEPPIPNVTITVGKIMKL